MLWIKRELEAKTALSRDDITAAEIAPNPAKYEASKTTQFTVQKIAGQIQCFSRSARLVNWYQHGQADFLLELYRLKRHHRFTRDVHSPSIAIGLGVRWYNTSGSVKLVMFSSAGEAPRSVKFQSAQKRT